MRLPRRHASHCDMASAKPKTKEDDYDGAIARIVDTDSANRIAGLRATGYLAAPGNGLTGVSQVPLLLEQDSEWISNVDSGSISSTTARIGSADELDRVYIRIRVQEINKGLPL